MKSDFNFQFQRFCFCSQSAQNNLKQHLAMVLEEVRQTKKIKYNIENDLAGKEVAMDIDHQVRLIFYVLAANFLAYLITKIHI